MFIIASSGRCGTYALCNGLGQYSDHAVLHEPNPRLLEEAFLKHVGAPYRTEGFTRRMQHFKERAGDKYGESFRAPNLLRDIHQVAPETRFLVLIRDPLEYIVSAHSKQVFQKKDIWDQTRIVPLELTHNFHELPLAEKLAWHWVSLNRYLLEFVESGIGVSRVAVISDLAREIGGLAEYLGVTIEGSEGLSAFLHTRPNSATSHALPEGYNRERLLSITAPVWRQALSFAATQERSFL